MIGHPGRQHSHQLAIGLARASRLEAYCSGQFNERQLTFVAERLGFFLPAAMVRNAVPFISRRQSLSRPAGTIINYLSRRLLIENVKLYGELCGFRLFDSQFSRLISKRRPSAVIGYEMACLNSFRMAKSLGIACILDAAACHHSLQDQQLRTSGGVPSLVGSLIRSRKDAELELADLLMCPSQLSAKSYVDAGVPPDKIVVNSLGVSAELFGCVSPVKKSGFIEFIFVANARVVKGADYVEIAASELQKAGVPATFHIVGGAKFDHVSGGSVEIVRHGQVSHQRLAEIFRRADCLLLPSRLESFGMVVLEALAAGVPVVVSKWVGASSLVNEGLDGWRVGEGMDAFLSRVHWCAENVEVVRGMHERCVQTARRNSWEAYQKRAVGIVMAAIRDY